MKHRWFWLGLMNLLMSQTLFPPPRQSAEFSRAVWLADYQALKRMLEIGYANPDSACQAKQLNLDAF